MVLDGTVFSFQPSFFLFWEDFVFLILGPKAAKVVGVNHYGQSILYACALLSRESEQHVGFLKILGLYESGTTWSDSNGPVQKHRKRYSQYHARFFTSFLLPPEIANEMESCSAKRISLPK